MSWTKKICTPVALHMGQIATIGAKAGRRVFPEHTFLNIGQGKGLQIRGTNDTLAIAPHDTVMVLRHQAEVSDGRRFAPTAEHGLLYAL